MGRDTVISGVYTIENIKNGHLYVGSAVNMRRRWAGHCSTLRRGTHHSPHLQSAWNKYGEEAFHFEVLEEWEPEFLVSMEQWWMNMLKPEYNTAPVAGSFLGRRHTEASRQKMSDSRAGTGPSPQCIAACIVANTGRTVSPETRAKLSVANLGHEISAGQRAQISAARRGTKASPETRAKMSVSRLGKPKSLEHRTRMLVGAAAAKAVAILMYHTLMDAGRA